MADAFDFIKAFDAMRQGVGSTALPATQGVQDFTPVVPDRPAMSAGVMVPQSGAASAVRPTQSAAQGSSGNVGPNFDALMRANPNLRNTSGYRDPEHNRAVGGVANSYHTQKDAYGHSRALDFVGSVNDMQNGAAWARTHGAKEVLIHNVGSGQHLHVAW